MKKKSLFLLPCIAAVAIGMFVGTKTIKSNANENSALLMENVEAISQNQGEPGTITMRTCYKITARVGTDTWKCGSAVYPDVDPCTTQDVMKINCSDDQKGQCYVINKK